MAFTSTSRNFLEVLCKNLNLDKSTVSLAILDTMEECFKFEPGFTCSFVAKTGKKQKCLKRATNKEQTYCNLHARYADPNKQVVVNGEPCNFILKHGAKAGQQCQHIGKEFSPKIFYCTG